MKMVTQVLNIVLRATDRASAVINRTNKKTNLLTDSIKKSRGAFMGLAFGALFGGMALNRFFTGLINSAVNAFKIVGTENSIFAQKTNELTAAWEFFKFSMIDALQQSPLFIGMIDNVIKLINWFSGLSEGKKQFLAISIAGAALVTKLLSIAGQIALVAVAFSGIQGVGISAFFTLLSVKIAALTAAYVAAVDAVLAFTAALLTNPITWIIGLIAVLIGFLIVLSVKYGGVGNALKAMVATSIVALGILGSALLFLVLTPLQLITVALLNVIALSDRFLGTNFLGSSAANAARKFVEFDPKSLTVKAAELAAQVQPEAVSDAGILEDFKTAISDAIKRGFEDTQVIVSGDEAKIAPLT